MDILPPSTQKLHEYKAALIPGLMHWPAKLLQDLQSYEGSALIGPRSGSKTENFTIPDGLPPALPMLDCRVQYVESLRAGVSRPLTEGGAIKSWFESLEGDAPVLETLATGEPVLVGDKLQYLAAWPDTEAMVRILRRVCNNAGIDATDMPEGVRKRATASHEFVFNYNSTDVNVAGQVIPAAGVLWSSK